MICPSCKEKVAENMKSISQTLGEQTVHVISCGKCFAVLSIVADLTDLQRRIKAIEAAVNKIEYRSR